MAVALACMVMLAGCGGDGKSASSGCEILNKLEELDAPDAGMAAILGYKNVDSGASNRTVVNAILQRSGVSLEKLEDNRSDIEGIFNLNNGAIALNMRRLGYSDDQILLAESVAITEFSGLCD